MEEQRPDVEVVAQKVTELCSRNWWVFLIGGIAAVVFGVLAFMNPGIALLLLAIYFAAYILIDGAVNIWGALNNRGADGWLAVLALGVLGVLAGGYALMYPPASMIALIFIVSFVAMLIGLTSIYLGWKIRAETDNEWVLFLVGGLSVLFSVVMMVKPGVAGVSIAYMIASWAILIGVLRIWFGLKIRNINHQGVS
jgi:uncharacterized membrane protein HdeD (DUF308 family)